MKLKAWKIICCHSDNLWACAKISTTLSGTVKRLPGRKDRGKSQEAAVRDFVVSGEATIDNPVEQRRNVRVELEQEHDGRLSQRVHLKSEALNTMTCLSRTRLC